MEYPLKYYERRNREIVSRYLEGQSVEYLCELYELKEKRMIQILHQGRVLRKSVKLEPARKLSIEDVKEELGLNQYRVRKLLLEQNGRWPYPN